MSVIVPDGMSVDQSLKLLWREAIRENIPNTIQKNRYRITETEKKHEKKKIWMKTKRKRRQANRKLKSKGVLRVY